jgi:hypothetical protein
MKFNDTTNYTGIIQHIDFLLFGDGTTNNTDYNLNDRTRNINLSLDEAVAELFKADPNFIWDDTTNSDFPIAKLDLTENQDHFTVPDKSLVVHRLRVKDENGKWKTLTPKLRRELSDSELEDTGTPDKYYKIDNAFFPVPIPDYGATLGIEIEFQRGANHFSSTDTTAEPGFASIFHEFLPVGAALRYAVANGMTEKIKVLSSEKERIKSSMREHYQLRSPDEPPRMSLKQKSVRRYGL